MQGAGGMQARRPASVACAGVRERTAHPPLLRACGAAACLAHATTTHGSTHLNIFLMSDIVLSPQGHPLFQPRDHRVVMPPADTRRKRGGV